MGRRAFARRGAELEPLELERRPARATTSESRAPLPRHRAGEGFDSRTGTDALGRASNRLRCARSSLTKMLSATRVRLSTTGGGAATTGSAGTSTKSAAGSASLRRFAAAASTRRSAPVRRRARGGSSYSTAAAFAAASGSSSEKPSSSTVRGAFPASSGAPSSSSSSEPFGASSGASSSLFSQAASSASSAASRSNSSSSSIAAAILCDAAVACSTSEQLLLVGATAAIRATNARSDGGANQFSCNVSCSDVAKPRRDGQLQLLLLGIPSVLQAASKDLLAAEESPGGMPANTLLRRRGVAGRRRGH